MGNAVGLNTGLSPESIPAGMLFSNHTIIPLTYKNGIHLSDIVTTLGANTTKLSYLTGIAYYVVTTKIVASGDYDHIMMGLGGGNTATTVTVTGNSNYAMAGWVQYCGSATSVPVGFKSPLFAFNLWYASSYWKLYMNDLAGMGTGGNVYDQASGAYPYLCLKYKNSASNIISSGAVDVHFFY